jgi:GNAT superfamily N-acetyltransferase
LQLTRSYLRRDTWLGLVPPISELHIPPLRQPDIEPLGDLYFPWTTREKTIAKWTRYLEEQLQGARAACVVEQQGRIVAYGHLLRSSEYPRFREQNVPEISDVWVFAEHRGQGIATALIGHLERLAKQEGYMAVGIGVGLYRDYGTAQRLYVRLGYQPDGEGITYKGTTVVPGESYPVDDDLILWLSKSLSEPSC